MTEFLDSLKSEWDLRQEGDMSRVPLYHRLYSVLKAAIIDGTIPFDAKMPTEQQLASVFNVSRITAKRAMDELAGEKLIARYRGKGSLVTYKYKPQPVRAPLVGMLENLIDVGKNTRVRVIALEQVIPPAEIRNILGIKPGDVVHKLIRVRSTKEGEPYAYFVSWTRGITKGFTKRNLEKTPRLNVLKQNKIELTKVDQVLSAENASESLATELEVDNGAALLSIRRHSYNDKGEIIDVLKCLYNPQRFQYAMVLSLD